MVPFTTSAMVEKGGTKTITARLKPVNIAGLANAELMHLFITPWRTILR